MFSAQELNSPEFKCNFTPSDMLVYPPTETLHKRIRQWLKQHQQSRVIGFQRGKLLEELFPAPPADAVSDCVAVVAITLEGLFPVNPSIFFLREYFR